MIQTATTSPNTELSREFIERAAWKQAVLGAINVLMLLLGARLLVLVAIGGAIVLTWYALAEPDTIRLIALGIYCGLVVVPSIVLAAMGR